jgi:hypothetical protein
MLGCCTTPCAPPASSPDGLPTRARVVAVVGGGYGGAALDDVADVVLGADVTSKIKGTDLKLSLYATLSGVS